MTARILAALAAGAAAGYAVPRALAAQRARRRNPGLRLATAMHDALGGQRAPLARMTGAIGNALQPGETVTYLSVSARDAKGRLAVYAVSATDELAHLTWRGDTPGPQTEEWEPV
jgi:hypothetical protein